MVIYSDTRKSAKKISKTQNLLELHQGNLLRPPLPTTSLLATSSPLSPLLSLLITSPLPPLLVPVPVDVSGGHDGLPVQPVVDAVGNLLVLAPLAMAS